MIPSFGGIAGARISDWGFYMVILVAALAGTAIIMGMKLAFEEDSQSRVSPQPSIIMVECA